MYAGVRVDYIVLVQQFGLIFFMLVSISMYPHTPVLHKKHILAAVKRRTPPEIGRVAFWTVFLWTQGQ